LPVAGYYYSLTVVATLNTFCALAPLLRDAACVPLACD